MKITDRILAAGKALTAPVEAKAAPVLELKASAAMQAAMMYRVGVEQWPVYGYKSLATKHRTNPVVRQCVQLIGEAVASIEPKIKIDGKEDGVAGVPGVDVEFFKRKLNRPNPASDRIEFVKALCGFLRSHGNGFIEAVQGATPDYAEFYALRPELMTITPGPDGWAMRYTYRPSTGRPKVWDVSPQSGRPGVLHIKEFSLDDDLWGHGALEACQHALEIYEQANVLAHAMFKNGAVPSGALRYAPQVPSGSAMPSLTEEQYQKLKKQLDEQMSGARNGGKPLLLEGGLEWEPFSMTMVDLQAMDLRYAAARDICTAFGVPPMVLGIPGDNTYSNYQEAMRAFYRQCALPMANQVYGAISRWWANAFRAPGLTFEIDPEELWALSDELAMKWQRVMGSLVHTTNEKREMLKAQPVIDDSGAGDVVLVSAGLVPLANVVEPPMTADPAMGDYAPASAKPGKGTRQDGDQDGKLNEGNGGLPA